jgi:hypothetical protein
MPIKLHQEEKVFDFIWILMDNFGMMRWCRCFLLFYARGITLPTYGSIHLNGNPNWTFCIIYENFAGLVLILLNTFFCLSLPSRNSHNEKLVLGRVARWHIFKPKIPIWVNFGGSYNGRCWYILWPFDYFKGHLSYFVDFIIIWYICFPFWYVVLW